MNHLRRLTHTLNRLRELTEHLAVATAAESSPPLFTLAATEGRARRVGVEIEFAELDLITAANCIADVFGGNIRRQTDYELHVEVPEFGEFRVEVDFALLKRIGREREQAPEQSGTWEQISEDLLASLAAQIMPCEIVTPPLPWHSMTDLDRLVKQLRNAGAKGTDDGLVYAFGVHFNIEAPSLQAAGILAYLRAFILLYDWLKSELRLDSLRRITPFIRPFPSRYARLILHPAYRPNRRILIDDYLKHNPTRNRALDLLPLFAQIDSRRVFAVIDDPLVKARPAYHYRMPNSFVGDPDWRLSDEWRSWLVIEVLAADHRRLRAMSREYLALLEQPFGDFFSVWTERSEQCLHELLNSAR